MTARWLTTRDPSVFGRHAGEFLATDPVAHTSLLTELNHVLRHREPGEQQHYGWCRGDGAVIGAFVQAPRHHPVLSVLPEDVVPSLAVILAAVGAIAVPTEAEAAVTHAWSGLGTSLRPRRRFVVWEATRRSARASIHPWVRTARIEDTALLAEWFRAFTIAHPEDPSDRSFVIDDPLADDGILLRVDDAGRPLAFASRSPVVAGILGLCWPDNGAAEAALDAMIDRLIGVVPHVVALSTDDDAETARWRGRDFRAAARRVLLTV